MTALILVAHGSRHPRAEPCLAALAEAVAARVPAADDVRVAWLELVAPSLRDLCAEFAGRGIRDAVVVPLLFTEAFHRTVDLPAQAADAGAATGVRLDVRDGIGLGEGVKKAVVRSFLAAADDPRDDVLLVAVGSSSLAANDAVHRFAAELDGMVPGTVRAAFSVGAGTPSAAEALGGVVAGTVVVPLFTAPGLLWDRVRDRAAEVPGTTCAEPLGELLADVVLARWLDGNFGERTRGKERPAPCPAMKR
ncbi:sirohydrochlorin chelatase [Corynebacterium hansenii]|uniref:Sirohydrochlorin chelatase n=1 Tax=Corynebacterium hansenii TaxID=394964 RepID=A0ABV7ZQY6_9CORY|nr:CbiX/SirB N-terminal domain-containing protein [Corynebacterium hansenii]WJZ01130.1 sirohydrochlorin cobaltochelatase [Corynebacterium hansenii]